MSTAICDRGRTFSRDGRRRCIGFASAASKGAKERRRGAWRIWPNLADATYECVCDISLYHYDSHFSNSTEKPRPARLNLRSFDPSVPAALSVAASHKSASRVAVCASPICHTCLPANAARTQRPLRGIAVRAQCEYKAMLTIYARSIHYCRSSPRLLCVVLLYCQLRLSSDCFAATLLTPSLCRCKYCASSGGMPT